MSERVERFLESYANGWVALDPDAIVAHLSVPLLLARDGVTEFYETEDAVRESVEAEVNRYRSAGVVRAAVEAVERIEPLPDDAWRATLRWRGEDAAGAAALRFAVDYTIVEDNGAFAIVGVDISASDRALMGAAAN